MNKSSEIRLAGVRNHLFFSKTPKFVYTHLLLLQKVRVEGRREEKGN